MDLSNVARETILILQHSTRSAIDALRLIDAFCRISLLGELPIQPFGDAQVSSDLQEGWERFMRHAHILLQDPIIADSFVSAPQPKAPESSNVAVQVMGLRQAHAPPPHVALFYWKSFPQFSDVLLSGRM